MPKKRKIFGQAGSFINPILRYFLEINVINNPADVHGSRIGKHFYRMCYVAKPQFLQPNFTYSYKENIDCPSSRLHIKYINGWEMTYYLQRSTFKNVLQSIAIYNEHLYSIRTMAGFDEEYDDELRIV